MARIQENNPTELYARKQNDGKKVSVGIEFIGLDDWGYFVEVNMTKDQFLQWINNQIILYGTMKDG